MVLGIVEKGLTYVTATVAVCLSLWHLAIVAGFLNYSTMDIRILHLTAILFLVFATAIPRANPDADDTPPAPEDTPLAWAGLVLRLVLAGVAVAVGLYIYGRWQPIAFSGGMTNRTDAQVGLVLIALVMIAVVRRIGWLLAIVAGVFIIYPLISGSLPGVLAARPYSIERLSIIMTTGSEGIFGVPLGVSATYIIIFTIFGAFLTNFGAGDFLFRLARALTRNARAASAKTAVVLSTLLGMISGSAAGNVAVTGTMTIPMMKREGYKPHQAGAIEAVVSAGGQLMPPVMGAAAFIMAEIIGRPYRDVMAAALIPALLFFVSILMIVHLRALRSGVGVQPADVEREPLMPILLPGLRFVVPFGLLVGLMVYGYSPFRASFIALLVLLAGSVLFEYRDPKGFALKILRALNQGSQAVVSIAVACAAAGMVAGVLAVTGLGSKISALIIAVSAGEALIALILTALMAIVLGMGLPTTAAYLILATVVTPPLVQMGVPLLTAHMFVFFFGCISTITPPVALASYVAASIAGSDINRTSWTAFGYGITCYILPFMFFFGPALLLDGTVLEILRAVATGLASVFCIAAAVVGYLYGVRGVISRCALAGTGLLLLYQSTATDIVGIAALSGMALYFRARERSMGQANRDGLAATSGGNTVSR